MDIEANGINSQLKFVYDAVGDRVAKIYDPNLSTTNNEQVTYHVRDASGNILGTYKKQYNGTVQEISLKERSIFGSNRTGNLQKSIIFNNTSSLVRNTTTFSSGLFERGINDKVYEIADHLGNVTMLLSDQKLHLGGGYQAQIESYQQYYPFGWTMPQRNANITASSFGFNGKENDQEWGSSLIQDYGFRLYNPSIAKFLSVDPLAPEYPELTTYQFASNTPIVAIDLDGLEAETIHDVTGIRTSGVKDGTEAWNTKLKKQEESDINIAVFELTRWAIRNTDVDGRPQAIYKLGFMRGGNNSISPAVHATNLYGEASNSQWISASKCIICIGKYKNKWKVNLGSIFHKGRSYFINIGQAKKTGSIFISSIKLRLLVNRFSKGRTTEQLKRIANWKSRQGFFGGEREVLFRGVEPSAIDSKTTVGLKFLGKGLMVYGMYKTGKSLYGAYEEGGGVNSRAFKNESIRQASAWGTAWVVGSSVASATSLTGPGAFLAGFSAGMIGGAFGYWFGDQFFTSQTPDNPQPSKTEKE